jgi:hypothetical protein
MDGAISGNKEGLRLLKESIERVLETGEKTEIPKEAKADFEAVYLGESCPADVKPTRADKLRDFGCLCVVATILVIIIFGIISLFKHGL